MNPAYEQLVAKQRDTHLLVASADLLSWDQETMLPPAGVAFRARQLKLLSTLVHERTIATETADLLAACEADPAIGADPMSAPAVNVRELRREFEHATRLPAALVAELSETQSLAQHAWAGARTRSDFAAFRPWLEKMVSLLRRKAECLGTPPGGESWDALGDLYEVGMRAADLEPLFRDLKAELTPLLQRIVGAGHSGADRLQRIELDEPAQEKFVRFVLGAMGFDFERGRMDRSTHPFCSGSHPDDVRITTRFHKDNFLDALSSTMHEGGHALYEQGLPPDQTGLPMGQAVSLGIHESQSRLWENMVGRSRAFWTWCQPHLATFFGRSLDGFGVDQLHAASNLIRPDFIRVEADEVCYNLHVMIRFEIERALMRGELDVKDIPEAWNQGYRDTLGLEVPDDARGCLQDVHWSCGLFGYFPTYTLGNIYAAQLFAAAERDLGDLDSSFARGDFAPLRDWLRAAVHGHGSRLRPGALIQQATGSAPDASHLIRYLKGKLLPLHGLGG